MQQQSQPDSEVEEVVRQMRNTLEAAARELDCLNEPETIFAFGQAAFDGDDVEQDFGAAAIWFQIAAEQGYSKAQHNLAVMYESGEGVAQDYVQAAKWYHMAADQGNAGSQNNLGALYEAGNGVAQDYVVSMHWYRRAAEGGDTNAPSNYKRLKERCELERYREIVFAFSDLAAHSPLIGDCALLPYPKEVILYAIKFVLEDYKTKKERATDPASIENYDKIIPTLHHLFTCLARDWHEIAAEDKAAIAKLGECDSFPEWALPLQRKYINEDQASTEAFESAYQVMKDKVDRETTDEFLVARIAKEAQAARIRLRELGFGDEGHLPVAVGQPRKPWWRFW